MNPERNSYCERLGLPVPRLEDVADRKQAGLFHLMVAALLERGRPMCLNDLAGRLRTAGVVAGSGDLALSLKNWVLPGDPHLYDILDRARRAGVPVDIVVGSAPGWADPWARARRVEVVNIEPWVVTVRQGTETVPIDRREIQAARMVGGSDGP